MSFRPMKNCAMWLLPFLLVLFIDRVDLNAAKTFGLDVARVPAYSPYAVAEVRNEYFSQRRHLSLDANIFDNQIDIARDCSPYVCQ